MRVDTIVSLSTPPGLGAISIVRLSGPDSMSVLQALIHTNASSLDERRATLLELHDPDDDAPLDRAMVTRFVAPASYTGEDVVELSCHGGWLIPELVVGACVRAGARQAEPGEFTQRAYLRGKLDLVQAEAIADLIEARSRALHRAAAAQLERGLSKRVSDIRERLVGVEALLAHHVDFPEEDDAPVPLDRVVEEASDLIGGLDAMLATAPEGELLREGALAVLAGRPNVGKSSLYNALLGEERAIVTEQPGTTRDALEATVQLGGFPFRLVDTAGLRNDAGEIEQLGIEVAQKYLKRADLILFCLGADEEPTSADISFLEETRHAPVVLIETKIDLIDTKVDLMGGLDDSNKGSVAARHGHVGSFEAANFAGRIALSVESGQGLDQLRALLPELVYSAVVAAGTESPVVTRRRHAQALTTARDEIDAFRSAVSEGVPAEVAATHLRSAETALEELLGVVSVDDVLDVVFREFCVGK